MVDANLTLLNNEIFGVMVDSSVTFKSLHHQKQIVRIGDIFDLAESAIDMFDVYFGDIGLSAKLLLIFKDDVAGIDNVELIASPIEGFKVVLVLLLIGPGEVVLIDELACFFIDEGFVHTVLRIVEGLGWLVGPFLFFEHGGLDLDAGF